MIVKKIFYSLALIVAVTGVALQLWLTKLSQERAAAQGQVLGSPERFRNYATVPDFQFTDRSGQRVSLKDLKGKVWLANFVYTTCPTTCPMLSNRFSSLQEKALAAAENDSVRMVSFSVDPDHDTPEVLKGYADALKATEKWLFLTGPREQIERVAREGFLVGFQKVPGVSNDISHSTKIALVDRNGVVRAYYDGVGENDESPKILDDLQTLLKESRP